MDQTARSTSTELLQHPPVLLMTPTFARCGTVSFSYCSSATAVVDRPQLSPPASPAFFPVIASSTVAWTGPVVVASPSSCCTPPATIAPKSDRPSHSNSTAAGAPSAASPAGRCGSPPEPADIRPRAIPRHRVVRCRRLHHRPPQSLLLFSPPLPPPRDDARSTSRPSLKPLPR